MHPALFKLFVLTNKAAIRRALRGAKTVRGALLLLFTFGFIALMVVPQVLSAIFMSGRPETADFSGILEPFMPMMLLGFCLLFVFTSAGEKAIYFSPAEVDFLFPAPFERRELLLFKLGKTALGLVFFSLFFSLTILQFFRSWPSAFVGILLSLALLQLVGMATALVGQIVAESAYTHTRKVLLGIVLIMAVVGLAQAVARAPVHGAAGLAASFRSTWPGQVLLAPFELFSRAIFAARWFPDLAGWGAAAAAVDLGLLIAILKLDANYLESAATISQKVYEQLRRTKQGGGIAMPASSRAGRIRLPQLPWLAGIGPIAWRQLLLAIRTSRHMFFTSIVLAVLFLAGTLFSSAGPAGAAYTPAMGIGLTAYLTFLFSMQLPWAFRGDLDHIDFLKTLPLHPVALTVGELAGGALLLTLLQVIMLALFTAAAPAGAPAMLVAAAFTAPFNGLVLGLSNLLFLVYPVRVVAGTSFDFQTFGKMMIFFLLQMLLMFPLLGIPAGAGALAYLFTGYSWPMFALIAWLVLLAELLPLVMLVAWAFQRFDPSTQTPA